MKSVSKAENDRRLRIGMRNVKTCLAVLICLLFYQIIGISGSYYAATAAILTMQGSMQKTVAAGLSRLFGTVVGAALGIALLYGDLYAAETDLSIVLATVGVMILIALLSALRQFDAIVIACVMLLSILLIPDTVHPFWSSLQTLGHYAVGIVVAIVINRFIRNPDRRLHLHRRVEEENGEKCSVQVENGSEPKESDNLHRERVIAMYQDMMDTIGFVQAADAEVGAAMQKELGRQRRNLELIASENLVSPAVMAAAGSVLTNKYAEGYPGKRYYGGCECVDEVERIAIERAKELFGAAYANVQPHSGAQANEAVYSALVKPGDTVLGMSLAQGGHLTHGSPVNFSGLLYHIEAYGVDDVTHRIDYDKLRNQALEVKPKMIVAGASAYPREIDFEKFSAIAKECGAYLFVDMAHIAGLVAGGVHMSPIPWADVTTTTTHKTLRGIRGGLILTNDEEIAKKINKAVFPGTQGGPLMHIIAAKAVGFGEALRDDFKAYQQQIAKNAKALAEALKEQGFDLVSGGTDNHLILVDLTKLDITGKDFEKRLDEVYITVNKNSIPNETRSPFVTSGIRIGTPAVTTRGLKEADMRVIANCMYRAATDFENQADSIRADVTALCAKYPLYE